MESETTTVEWGAEDLPATGLSAVAESAAALRAAQWERERVEGELKRINERIRRIETEELPGAMSELGLEKITLEGGDVVSVKDEVSASITESNRAAAHAWLRENALDSIIKRQLTISFGKGEDAAAAECLDTLMERFPDNEVVDREAVHPGTLKAFVRERVAIEKEFTGAPPLPRVTFGVWEGKRATVKHSKDRLI
jgi:arginine deiminase